MGTAPMTSTSGPHVMANAAIVTHPLAGPFNVAGTYTHPISPGGPGGGNPDTGSQYEFTGKGIKTSLGGRFTMTGHLSGPGFIANGRFRGRMTIKTAHGAITLAVHSDPTPPGPLPSSLAYSIIKGTGRFANSSGKGRMAVSASDTTHKFVVRY